MSTGFDTTRTIRRAPRDLALSTFIDAERGGFEQPWIRDHRLILDDLPYAEDNIRSSAGSKLAKRTDAGDPESEPRLTTPNPFLRSAVGAVGSGAVRRRRQVVTVISAAVLAVLVYLALQGTLLRPTDPPILHSTTPGAQAATDNVFD